MVATVASIGGCFLVVIFVSVVLLLCDATESEEEGRRHPHCICSPTVRIEVDPTGGGGGGGRRAVCNNATVNWLLNSMLERMSMQSDQINELVATMKKMEEEMSEGHELLTAREKEVTDMRNDIRKLKSVLTEKNTRIGELEQELYELNMERRLQQEDRVTDTRSPDSQNEVSSYPQDCSDVQKSGMRYSGIYTVYPETSSSDGLQVFCDLNTDGGHWTVIQRRQDGSESFERSWSEYRKGFGHLTKEFWLGNENIHKISSQRSNELRVDIVDHESVDYFAVYSSFWIGNESDRYSLHLGQYNGNAGDSLSSHNGWPFSTIESDNDGSRSGNCSELYGGGGWWYSRCYDANLNGRYRDEDTAKTIVWYKLPKDELTSLKSTEMKIRPQKMRDST